MKKDKLEKFREWLRRKCFEVNKKNRKSECEYHEGFEAGLLEAYSEFCRIFEK